MITGLLLATFVSAEAAPLKPTWSSSSQSPTDEAGSYDAANLGDGKVSTAWFEGVDGAGLNEWVQADLGGEKSIASFTMVGGWQYSKTYWGHYNRPKVVVVEFSDASTQEFTLQDSFGPQTFTLPSAKKTSTLKFKFKSTYSSDAYNDTAVSEIQIRDTAKDPSAPIKSVTASTTFPADADGGYAATNTIDGLVDTMWCEGNKSGDGTGDWVEFTFAGQQTVSGMALRNGNGTGFGLYMKGNRATEVSLSFSDGSKETLAVKDLISEQTLSFASHTADKVRVTVNTVKKGSEFNDLCLSEVRFLP
jgi:hypothetical protein